VNKSKGGEMVGKTILEMQNISKVYSTGVVANQNVQFEIAEGEIHALAGENGAGKSTLMKVLFGIETADEGKVILDGQPIQIKSPLHAIEHGIGMVHQHFMLVPSLTVAENMMLGLEPKKHGLIDYRRAEAFTREVAEKYNLPIDPSAKVSSLPVGLKQRVEILKALSRGIRILILDEPTAVLTPQETEELFHQLLAFKEQGNTIIFISHKLGEIKQICDRITIMRAGKCMGTYDVSTVTEQEISSLMVGRDVILEINKKPVKRGEKVLEVKNVSQMHGQKKALNDISFNIHKGQILGVAGVEGNGQRELVNLLVGKTFVTDGEILINKVSLRGKNVKKIRQMKVSHIPEDRMIDGAASEASIEENIISDKNEAKYLNKGIFMNWKAIRMMVDKMIDYYRINCDSLRQPVGMLSGGNIQKVVAARELARRPEVVIANQPTRGVDVSAAEFIHGKLLELRDEGTATLLVSADLNEVLGLSDDLIVMHDGEIAAYFKDSAQVDEKELGMYMLGSEKMTKEEMGGLFDE